MTTNVDDVGDQPLSYEETLHYTQNIRRRIVTHFTEKQIPNDPKEVNVVLKALADMDTAVLNERKNDIDKGNADSAKVVAEAALQFIQMQKNRNPFERDSDTQREGVVPSVRAEDLGDFELLPGETEIGISTETSAEFIARMEAQRQARLADES